MSYNSQKNHKKAETRQKSNSIDAQSHCATLSSAQANAVLLKTKVNCPTLSSSKRTAAIP